MDQVVYSVDWILTGQNATGHSVELIGSTAVAFDPTAQFVNLDQLTDAEIAQWIIANTAADTMLTHYGNLDNQLSLVESRK